MLNLIRADFYKTIHGKVLKVCFLMMTGWIFLCAYAQKATIGINCSHRILSPFSFNHQLQS